MMKLILVRHGETDWNNERRWQGQLDVPLNDTGEWQARQVGQALADEPIARLVSSDLQRAQTTATAIAAACDLTILTDARLREIGFGSWEGLSIDQIMEQDGDAYRRWRENPSAHAPIGGETLDVTGQRVLSLWQEIREIDAGTIVVVSHGGTLRILLSHLLQLPPQSFWQLELDNASLSTIKINQTGNTLISLNDTQHLQIEGEENEFN